MTLKRRTTSLTFAFTLGLVALAPGSASAEPPAPARKLAPGDLDTPSITMTLGKGAPQATVIFMHGLGGRPDGYQDMLRTVLSPPKGEGAIRVVSIWMRPRQGLHTMTDQLARARKAIDAEPGPVFLMGHSFGGKAAVKLAAEYPEQKVRGIIALAPSVNMLQSYWKQLTGERVLPGSEVVDARLVDVEKQLAEHLADAEAREDRDAIKSLRGNLDYARTMRDLVKHDEPGTETNVKRPTLVVHGTDDEAVSIHYARRFADANANAVQLVELPGAGHGFRDVHTEADMSKALRTPVQQFLAKAGVNAPSPAPRVQDAPAPGPAKPRFGFGWRFKK